MTFAYTHPEAHTLSHHDLLASIEQARSSQRYFDAADSPQWTLETSARNANDRWLHLLRQEWARRYSVNEGAV